MKKKSLVAVVGAVALVGAIGIGSTFAYFTDTTNEVTNTFTMGSVEFKDSLGTALLESKVEVKDGEYVDADGANNWESIGNTYTNLYPGQTVVKDPTVLGLSKDSLDAYVFVKVTGLNTTDFSKVKSGTIDLLTAKKDDVGKDGWIVYQALTNGEVILYQTLTKDDTAKTVFESVTINPALTDTVEGKALSNIKVTAYAIQKSGFDSEEDPVSAAWSAYNTQNAQTTQADENTQD